MKIDTAGKLLEERIASSTVSLTEETPFHRAAGEIMEMAGAYLRDGRTFLISGDAVNSLASYAYGLGWLDAGIYTGLISCKGSTEFITLRCDDEIPDSLSEHLEEKTGRYHRMLDSAAGGVEPAPDPESPVSVAAERIITEARRHLETGKGYEVGEEPRNLTSALWHFSYGYGWLDAGVRCGILTITGDRRLFTV